MGADDSAASNTGVNSYSAETQYDEVQVDQGILNDVTEHMAEQTQPEPVQTVQEPSQQELNFKALREEIDRIKVERDEFRLNLDLLKANAQQLKTPPPEPKKFLDGMDEHEIPNVQEIRKAFEQREAEFQSRLEEIQVQQQFADYNEVLEKYTAPLLKQKPHLAEGIYGARNKALYAYELGKNDAGPTTSNSTSADSTERDRSKDSRKLAQAWQFSQCRRSECSQQG